VTKLLEQAFTEASKLAEVEQNALEKWVLEELESEKAWDRAFAASEDKLEKLSNEALCEHQKGKTKPLSLKKL
jgi:hypothetical protein